MWMVSTMCVGERCNAVGDRRECDNEKGGVFQKHPSMRICMQTTIYEEGKIKPVCDHQSPESTQKSRVA